MSPFTAKRPEDLASEETLLSMSGLEFMRAIADGKISGAPMGACLNFWVDEIEEGRAVFRGIPKFAFFNPMGTLHGGWYGTLLDSCLGCAVMTTLPRGMAYTTLEYKVNLTRALPEGREIVAEGIVSHAGRRTAVATGEIRGAEDGKLYATGSTTCIIMQP